MQWFFIALTAPILWSMTNISDQYLVAKFSTSERSSGGLVLFSSLIGIFVAFIIGVFTTGILDAPMLDKLLLILTGGAGIAWIILYLFALEVENVSIVVTWFLTVPIFGYVLGYLFLSETLSTQQILGSVVVLLGALFISLDFRDETAKFKWKPSLYMILACFLVAVSGIIFKYVTVEDSFWISSFWQYVGLGIFGLIIYAIVPKYRNEFMAMNRAGGAKIFTLNTISETLTIIGNFATNYALLLAPVTMIYIVGNFQPAILLIMTLLLTKFFPNVIKEDMSKRVLIPKIFAMATMTLGSIILLT